MSRNPAKTANASIRLTRWMPPTRYIRPARPVRRLRRPKNPRSAKKQYRPLTGKNWQDWFRLLDDAGAARMTHKEIVGIVGRLDEDHRVSGWWRQSIAVAYEKARGLREKHEHVDGYSVSASKTIPAIADQLFAGVGG